MAFSFSISMQSIGIIIMLMLLDWTESIFLSVSFIWINDFQNEIEDEIFFFDKFDVRRVTHQGGSINAIIIWCRLIWMYLFVSSNSALGPTFLNIQL